MKNLIILSILFSSVCFAGGNSVGVSIMIEKTDLKMIKFLDSNNSNIKYKVFDPKTDEVMIEKIDYYESEIRELLEESQHTGEWIPVEA